MPCRAACAVLCAQVKPTVLIGLTACAPPPFAFTQEVSEREGALGVEGREPGPWALEGILDASQAPKQIPPSALPPARPPARLPACCTPIEGVWDSHCISHPAGTYDAPPAHPAAAAAAAATLSPGLRSYGGQR